MAAQRQPPAPDAEPSEAFDPSTPEANRARTQGLGVGQKEINRQRDPTRIPSAEQYGRDDRKREQSPKGRG